MRFIHGKGGNLRKRAYRTYFTTSYQACHTYFSQFVQLFKEDKLTWVWKQIHPKPCSGHVAIDPAIVNTYWESTFTKP